MCVIYIIYFCYAKQLLLLLLRLRLLFFGILLIRLKQTYINLERNNEDKSQ